SLQVRDAGPADHERAAGVDRLHQVVALDLQRLGAGQVDRRGVVDAYVDPAEPLGGLRDGGRDLGLVADVADYRQRLAACRLDLRGRGVYRPLQPGMRLGRLGDQRDVGAVPRRPDRDRQADATAAAGDEQGLALEGHRCLPFIRTQVLVAGRARGNPVRSGSLISIFPERTGILLPVSRSLIPGRPAGGGQPGLHGLLGLKSATMVACPLAASNRSWLTWVSLTGILAPHVLWVPPRTVSPRDRCLPSRVTSWTS